MEDVIYTDAHRYSYAYYKDHPQGGKFVMHTCDNPGCVNPDHLEQGTPLENTMDMIRKGRNFKGERAVRRQSKLTEDQVREIAADARPYKQIAESYGCGMYLVVDIKNRHRWKFLENLVVVKNKRGSSGENRSKTLTEADVREIRASSETGANLARRYNLSQQTICDIRMRRSWKNVV